ncbi:MAG: DUF4258 domain-containing protein [bacterium]
MGKAMFKFELNNKKWHVQQSYHAKVRMEERNIDFFAVVGDIIALGNRIETLAENNEEAMIIDKNKDISVVAGFQEDFNIITIITVIDKANVFVKDGTSIERVS